jgi:CRISPR-associated protein (TIGR03984 family)
MSNDRILYSRAANKITLFDALKNCAGCFSDAVGLFYSPEACKFGKVQGDLITDETGKDLALIDNNIFEARIFNEETELRWLNQPNNKGIAVLLSSRNNITSYLSDNGSAIEAIDIIPSQYLLWGEGTGKKEIAPNKEIKQDWSCISAARIGKLAVPVAGIEYKDRVQLKFVEYLDTCDEHGNVAVVEERLLGLSKY